MEIEFWKKYLPEFREKTAAFYQGHLSVAEYKGFSGLYGSYAQRGGKASMLRLRMTAGCVTKEKLAFIAKAIRDYKIDRVHFTTCETVQLHNLGERAVTELLEKALDAGIITMGGGGDFPRNVMCSPLSGVEAGEYFDVMPWAKAAGEYLMTLIPAEKMPRKLKVCFSNSPANVVHATYRDLGFVAREDQTFDVYSAGGLGNNAKLGILVAEQVRPQKILYYIKAMWLMFCAYGNYKNRGKARTRYMQETFETMEAYREAFQEKLREVLDSGEDMDLEIMQHEVQKKEDGSRVSGKWILPQKQNGLYTVKWHPIGGQPRPEILCELSDLIADMENTELRLAPDGTAYIINLTGAEAEKVQEVIFPDQAGTLFETSVSCIGASICQVGLRDSQELLWKCVKAVRQAEIPDGALPQIHISGCTSSCGTHQTGVMGFRGAVKNVDGKPQPAYIFYINGCERQGQEQFGYEAGTMLAEVIPAFLVELGQTVAASGMDYSNWYQMHAQELEALAGKYLG